MLDFPHSSTPPLLSLRNTPTMSDLQGRKVFKVFNQEFIVDERYNVTKELGQGAYGIVCAATNNTTGEGVAIKKVDNVASLGSWHELTSHKGHQCL